MMRKLNAFAEWLLIVFLPVALYGAYTTDSVGLLRFVTIWFMISVTFRCIVSRLEARGQRLMEQR